MLIYKGLYLFNRHDYTIGEAEAMKFIRTLFDDARSDNPCVNWGYHPERSSLSIFLGTGFNNGTINVTIEKKSLPGGIELVFHVYEGPILKYTVADLCYEPEKSKLLKLYTQVAPMVLDRTLGNPNRVGIRRIITSYEEQ